VKFNELEAIYRTWLHLDHDPHIVKLIYAIHIANQYDGNPVWAFLIGPAGCGKTQLLTSLDGSDDVVSVSSLTANALASGWSEDASLLFKLSDKTLVVEDMSAILELPSDQRSQVFSILRAAYNGEYTRAHGKGEVVWKGKFGMLGGATNAIEFSRTRDALLGERFLNIRIRVTKKNEIDIMESAFKSVTKKTAMGTALKGAADNFLQTFRLDPTKRNLRDRGQVELIRSCAIALARARSTVIRDSYHRDEILAPAEVGELGTRLASQLVVIALAAKALGCTWDEVDELIYRITIDSVPYIRGQIIRSVAKGCNKLSLIKNDLKMSENPTARHLEDLLLLGILKKKKGGWYSVNNDTILAAIAVAG
jgi:hypothetical protein